MAPSTAAFRTVAPARQWSSMKVDSSTEFDTETPMHMIEPMNDSMFSVVPVTSRMMATPQTTPGTAADGNQPQPERLEVAGQQDEDHHDRQGQADGQRVEHLRHRRRPGRGR